MDDKTLVERLRRTHVTQSTFGGVAAGAFHSKPVNPDGEEAATRIEALEARLEIDPSHPYDGIYARDETIRLLEQRIEALEAGNRKLALDLLATLGQNADALESQP